MAIASARFSDPIAGTLHEFILQRESRELALLVHCCSATIRRHAIEQLAAYGLSVTPEQRAMILDYLATYMGPNPGTPGNPGPAPPSVVRP